MPRDKSTGLSALKGGRKQTDQNDSTKLKMTSIAKTKCNDTKSKAEKTNVTEIVAPKKKKNSKKGDCDIVPDNSKLIVDEGDCDTTALNDPKSRPSTTTHFCEEDNYVEFEVMGDNEDFLSEDEELDQQQQADTNSSQSEEESDEDGEIVLS